MADQFIGKVLAEKYQIDSLMREEALGNLYRGTHLLMEKPVCVKILSPSLAVDETIVKNFANEARTVSRISHANILNVTDYGSDQDGTVFIVFEDVAGETLKEVSNRIGRFTLKRANRIVKEIASALSTAHTNGIIHQNLTSENILIRQTSNNTEEVKVLNFGTAPFDINDLDYPVEKAYYLSPEQCSNTKEVDSRSDVYSLGVILYEMLTGEAPLKAPTTTDLMLKHLEEMPLPITAFRRDLPKEVDDILLTALAKNPEIRYQTVNEFADELNKIAPLAQDSEEEEVIIITPKSATANTVVAPEQPQNNLWKTAFIVLAGVTLLGAFFIYMTSVKQTNPSTTLQTDANGSPVQPVSPATGTTEQNLSNMDAFNPNYANTNTMMSPDGGGAYNPYWDSGTRPPGAPPTTTGGYGDPYPVMPSNSGPTVYVDPANGSIFMPNENGNSYVLVPKPANSNVNTQTPKKNANTNVNAAPPANTTVKPSPNPPAANTATPKATPAPKTTPAETKPKTTTTPPSTTEKRPVSGKNQDTN